jgi:hypothetical protein
MFIETKTVGQRVAGASRWELREAHDVHVMRDLIDLLVRREVSAFLERQEERKLARFLTNEQIVAAADAGRVCMGSDDLDQKVDPDQAVEGALTAFQDGIYYVFLDEAQIERLDSKINLRVDSQLLFLRLVPLAGG